MNRNELIGRLRRREPWDVLVIGGGATGLGAALDAASRGFDTLLLEQSDFAKGTSSRSTKLIHGGVRYLRAGHIRLVRESLRERRILLNNAAHLVRPLPFIVPTYTRWEGIYYGAGLKLYDLLAGGDKLEASQPLARDETLKQMPALKGEGLRGGVRYVDAQFDDARLAVTLARSVADHGGVALNYVRVLSFLKKGGRVAGVLARDEETENELEIRSRTVINAGGVFTDRVRWLDRPGTPERLRISQGAHVTLDASLLPGATGLLIPRTPDGRVLFVIPWEGRLLLGTTETPLVGDPTLEPRPLPAEIDYLLSHAATYLSRAPGPGDVRSVFAGLRPLVGGSARLRTSSIPRDYEITVADSRLVTVTGGKWTTYRVMGRGAVDRAVAVGGLPGRLCRTHALRLHGYARAPGDDEDFLRQRYGTDAEGVLSLERENADWGRELHSRLPYRVSEVVWAVRNEMARTVEDVLSRRTRALVLDAAASLECAPEVARLMAAELGRGEEWVQEQLQSYEEVAKGYMIAP